MEKMVKIVFAGDTNVGKTSIIETFNRGPPNQGDRHITATVGASFCAKQMKSGNKRVTLGLWDTAGQERYKAMSSVYFRNSCICVLVFDLTNLDSFNNVKEWRQRCELANLQHAEDYPLYVLVGNKSDINTDHAISPKIIEKYREKCHYASYFETSAKSGAGINDFFNALAELATRIKVTKVGTTITIGPAPSTGYCERITC